MEFKVISGGQTGADRAGLEAARNNNIPTGGYAPENYWTTEGADPELKNFGLIEIPIGGAEGYRRRTKMNVQESSLTLAFASNMNSRGEIFTRNTCLKEGNAYFPFRFFPEMEVKDWLESSFFQLPYWNLMEYIRDRVLFGGLIINVAGNSTKTSPDCFNFAYQGCDKIFKEILQYEQ
jgi:hypothetical protein